MDGKLTYYEVYREGAARLGEADIEEAELDARLLLEFVCGTDRNTLLVHGERDVSEEEYGRYCGLIERRAAHVPLQHLTGEQDFMGLTFLVNKDVLVPRQDTEVLVEEVMKHLHDGMRILDLCTGSGCILLSLLHYSNDCEGVGVDLSARALSVAGKNYEIQRTQRPDMKARFLEGNLFEGLEDRFDMIVSNPPYIETAVIDTLMPEVREHEPFGALDGGEDGLQFYRRIVAQAPAHLRRGAVLLFEIGCGQGEAVIQLMQEAGFAEVKVLQDYAGLDRVVYGIKSGSVETKH